MRFKNEYIKKIRDYVEAKKLTFSIDTMGCQMNENDSEKYRGIIEQTGFKFVEDVDSADLILFNTCTVRENAENTLFGRLGKLKSKKIKGKDKYIAVVGCMSQQEHILDKIKKSYSYVDIVLGTNSMGLFPKKLYDAVISKQKSQEYYNIDEEIIEEIPVIFSDSNKASVSIVYGCNNFCTYCIVPYVRGRERSREVNDILNDIKNIAKTGRKEIILLGQNVNSYGKDLKPKISFSELLNKIEEIDGIDIIRFMSPHPKDFTDELIDVIANSKKISHHIHLPLQAGSSKILEKMNRKYTKDDYLLLVKKMKDKIKNVSFSTDIIVGFPGETEEDFLETLDVAKKVQYDQIYMFIYSKRTGTAAAKFEDNTPNKEKVERLERLKKLFEKIVEENNEKLVGKTLKVLVEGKSKNNSTLYTGRTDNNKIIIFEANDSYVGKIANLKIFSQHLWFLKGQIVD